MSNPRKRRGAESSPDTPATQPIYRDSVVHLADEIRALKLLIALRIQELKHNQEISHSDYRGMFLHDQEVKVFLGENSDASLTPEEASAVISVSRERYVQISRDLVEKVQRSLDAGVYLSIPILMHRFGLHPMELKVLLLAVAIDLDQNFKRVFAYVQNNVYKENPSVELVTRLLAFSPEERLLCRRLFSPDGNLRRHTLIEFRNAQQMHNPLLSEEYGVPRSVTNFILGSVWMEDDTRYFAQISVPEKDDLEVYLPEGLNNKLEHVLELYPELEAERPIAIGGGSTVRNGAVFFFTGPRDSGQLNVANSIAFRLNKRMIEADIRKYCFYPERSSRHLRSLFRDARLFNAGLHLKSVDVLQAPENYFDRDELLGLIREHNGLLFISSEKPIDLDNDIPQKLGFKAHFDVPMTQVRDRIWQTLHDQNPALFAPDINLHFISRYHPIGVGSIHNAIRSAIDHVLTEKGSGDALSTDDLQAGCRAQMNRRLAYLATYVKPTMSWEDLILPDETKSVLREIVAFGRLRQTAYTDWGFEKRLALGKGLGCLFSGPPGTGKTMAAGIIGRELDREIYKVNLATVVSKYIGETEKNLERVFNEARESNSILLFDEADSLFSKRTSDVKSSTDRYANLEVNYLLQKVEEFEGICILTTNLQAGIDKAFIRRLNFRVIFPFPEETYRAKLWENILPTSTPQDAHLDFRYLAHKFPKLSGGNIKNAVLRGAILALAEDSPVGTRHLDLAGTKECREIGALWKVNLTLEDWIHPDDLRDLEKDREVNEGLEEYEDEPKALA